MTENQCGLTAAGKEINKRMCKLLSNRGPSSGYKMRHKKKLLSMIFLQALDSWQSGQSQPHLIGLVCFFYTLSASLHALFRKTRHRQAIHRSPFFMRLSWACQAEDGYVLVAVAWCCSSIWWYLLLHCSVQFTFETAQCGSFHPWCPAPEDMGWGVGGAEGEGVGGDTVKWRWCESLCRTGGLHQGWWLVQLAFITVLVAQNEVWRSKARFNLKSASLSHNSHSWAACSEAAEFRALHARGSTSACNPPIGFSGPRTLRCPQEFV